MRKKGEGLSPLLLQDNGGRNEEEAAAAAAIIFWSAKENITAEKTGKGWLVGMGGVGCCFTISPLLSLPLSLLGLRSEAATREPPPSFFFVMHAAARGALLSPFLPPQR